METTILAQNCIVDLIIRGELAEGSTLSERKVASLCSITQIKARECLKEMFQLKLVEQMPKHYSKIAVFDDTKTRKVFVQREFHETRTVEQLADQLSTATPKQRDEILQPIRDEIRNMKKAIANKDFVAFTYSDMHFHSEIAKAVCFDPYAAFLETLYVSYFLTTQARADKLAGEPGPRDVIMAGSSRILSEHELIHKALLKGNKPEASKVMREHLIAAERHWEQALQGRSSVLAASNPQANQSMPFAIP